MLKKICDVVSTIALIACAQTAYAGEKMSLNVYAFTRAGNFTWMIDNIVLSKKETIINLKTPEVSVKRSTVNNEIVYSENISPVDFDLHLRYENGRLFITEESYTLVKQTVVTNGATMHYMDDFEFKTTSKNCDLMHRRCEFDDGNNIFNIEIR